MLLERIISPCLPSLHTLRSGCVLWIKPFSDHCQGNITAFAPNLWQKIPTTQFRNGNGHLKLFRDTHDRSFKPANISSGFRKCGIYPLDPNAIPCQAFASSQPFETIPTHGITIPWQPMVSPYQPMVSLSLTLEIIVQGVFLTLI